MVISEGTAATDGGHIAVIIAARNAAGTIGAAVRSALSQPETSEVIVVDDGSTDNTGASALAAAAGDPRLRVLRPEANVGPAAARNIAIAASAAPVIALLDADDMFLPGRLGRLTAIPGWDLIADNIAFVPDTPDLALPVPRAVTDTGLSALDLAEFVRGNLPRKNRPRGELGFLKPLIRRDFIDRHGLRYNTDLRLGEDYDLYARALMAGARFLVSHGTGYVARVRGGSLSAKHRSEDLDRLSEAVARHLALLPPGHAAVPSMRRLHRSLCARHLHRAFLDRKREAGFGAAMALALHPPGNLRPIAGGILRDKLSGAFPPREAVDNQPRTLLPPIPTADAPRSAAKPSRA
jgi:succinoglycan biosynthesis protein ExoU